MKIKEFQALSPEDQFKEYEKLVKAARDAEAELSEAQTDIEGLKSELSKAAESFEGLSQTSEEANAKNADLIKELEKYGDYDTKVQLLKDAEEELKTAREIIDEQNKAIEKLDEEKGTETGRFITHKKKKLEVRVPKFRVKGQDYTIEDLKKNPQIEVAGKEKGDANRKIGLTDYLLEVESPILEVEE